ncbi:MAG: DUF1684 domain-containing protein [Chloroflexi bacterium]|nr:MAG: DUF1684 domain-containing protein [Chloroflexota bacterium]
MAASRRRPVCRRPGGVAPRPGSSLAPLDVDAGGALPGASAVARAARRAAGLPRPLLGLRPAAPLRGRGRGCAGPAPGALALGLPNSGEDTLSFERIGALEIPFAEGPRRLSLFWMAGYAGGLFLPFRDATNGAETYGAGRYLLDAAKSADLGGDVDGRLVLDFNFAYQPSCAFDPKWACPLAPPENRLDLPIRAGERLSPEP